MLKKKKSTFKVAIIQQAPVFLNINETIEKANILVKNAAMQNAEIVIFPETWIPGYPVWLDFSPNAAIWNYAPAKSIFNILVENSLTIPGKNFDSLCKMAQKNNVYLVVGAHELVGGTVYNSLIYIDKNGINFKIHRKLIPTYTERMIWGRGDGSTLDVISTEFGNIGGLICWEHWMPLARAAMHNKQETIHIAQWPYVKELHQIASRHYAFEGQCFVVAAGCILSKQDTLDGIDSLSIKNNDAKILLEEIPCDNEELLLKGGSCIIAPDGSYLTEPAYDTSDIIYAKINLALINEGHLVIDTDGHYSRPDIFKLNVNTQKQINVKFKEYNI